MLTKPHWSRWEWTAFALMMTILVSATVTAIGIYYYSSQTFLVCPGCNTPELLFIDHYSVQNNTSQMPTLLTIWFRGDGRQGQSLSLLTLYLGNATKQYPFQMEGVTIPANSVVPVGVDSSSYGFYLDKGQCYGLRAATDKYIFGFGSDICG